MVPKNQDWFDEHDEHLLQLIENRNKASPLAMQSNTILKKKIYRATFRGTPEKSNQMVERKRQGTTDRSRQEGYEGFLYNFEGNLWPTAKTTGLTSRLRRNKSPKREGRNPEKAFRHF